MQENNPKDSLNNDSPVMAEIEPETVVAEPEIVPVMAATVDTPVVVKTSPMTARVKKYGLMALVIVVMVLALVFVLEKEGRISTGLFSSIIGDSKGAAAVALVNGTKIVRADYDSSLQQLLNMAAAQGANTSDEAVVSELKTQALDTLINGELLRQSALDAGMEAAQETIDARYTQITEDVGGPEVLLEKMTEFGISEKSLRRDIENEILIQGLFDSVINTEPTEVTEAEIKDMYEQSGGEKAGLPPLAEVKDKVVEQIERNRQQEQISKYLEGLRQTAKIEILI
jgi:hypothetical protein